MVEGALAIVVLLVLVVLWLAVLAPPAIRYFSGERRRADSVGDFNDALTVLGRTNGHGGGGRVGERVMAGTMTAAQRRRRDVLVGLLGALVASLALSVLVGGTLLWSLTIVVGLLLGGYVVLLVQIRQRSRERQRKVRYIPTGTERADELALRRVVAGSR